MNKITNRLLIILIIVIIIIPFVLAFFYTKSIEPKNPRSEEKKTFVVRPGETVSQIAKNLEKEGLIKNAFFFRFLVERLAIAKNIQAGDFLLSPSMSGKDIALTLTHGAIDIWITIPEGFRKEEIAEKLAQKFPVKKEEFIQKGEEGYLFPDTYLIPKEATVDQIITIMRENFDKKFNQDLKDLARQNGLSQNEVLTLASIVERESKDGEERLIIAGILLKRARDNYLLEADATIQYVLGYDKEQKTWWKKDISGEDKKIKSLYNTYQNVGIPPAPICNPGLSAIKAVLNPKETDYYFYLHDREGRVHFAQTFAEHRQNIRQFL